MSFISYAQNCEDVMLWRALKHVQNGVYVDIGAQHPLIHSVSKAFYEAGWRGIHIEPVPAYAELLRKDRPDETVLQVALGVTDGTLELNIIDETGLSTAVDHYAKLHENERGFKHRRVQVPMLTMKSALHSLAASDVHWLKIDVEGFEEQVLRGWDSTVLRPWIMVIEATIPMSQQTDYANWDPIVSGAGYQFVYFDGLNRFYVAEEHEELIAAFSAPPNVFDGVQMFAQQQREQWLQNEWDAAVAKAQQLQSERDAAIVKAQPLQSERDAAIAKAQQLQSERDAAIAKAQPLQSKRDAAITKAQQLQSERDAAIAKAQQLQSERDAAIAKAQPLQSKRDAAITKAQQLQSERDAAIAKAQQLQSERDAAIARAKLAATVADADQERIGALQTALDDAHTSALAARQSSVELAQQLREVQINIAELNHWSHHWWTVACALDQERQSVYASKSWKITAPLRRTLVGTKLVAAQGRRGPQWLRRKIDHLLRPVVLWAMRKVLSQRRVTGFVLGWLAKHPSLKSRLRRLATPAFDNHAPASTPAGETALNLPPRAARLYADLQIAVEKRNH